MSDEVREMVERILCARRLWVAPGDPMLLAVASDLLARVAGERDALKLRLAVVQAERDELSHSEGQYRQEADAAEAALEKAKEALREIAATDCFVSVMAGDAAIVRNPWQIARAALAAMEARDE